MEPRPFPSRPPSSIAQALTAEGGRVTFARFMELALTHPTLGYYSRVDRLLGPRGDFSTAPSLSPFFNRTMAALVTELVDAALGTEAYSAAGGEPNGMRPSVVELGGGEGHLAEGMLRFWEEERPEWRSRLSYRVVEKGRKLLERQRDVLAERVAVGWDVGWGVGLEEVCAGTRPLVIVANEYVDAMPVHLVEAKEDGVREAYVEPGEHGLVQVWGGSSPEVEAEIEFLFGTLDSPRRAALTADGTLEIRAGLGDLVRQVAGVMPAGSLVNVDYGEWFPGVCPVCQEGGAEGRPLRKRTVRGYFKHQLVTDLLARPGKQDLTADIDFAALDLHGRREGFETVLFTTLSAFLRGGGAENELRLLRKKAGVADPGPDPCGLDADRQATALSLLLDEQDVGGTFKVMVQVKE